MSRFERVESTDPFSDPDYPEAAVAFIQVHSKRIIPVPEDVDAEADAPPDAEVKVRPDRPSTWTFGPKSVIPAHLLPEKIWKHTHDQLLAVDADGDPVSEGRDDLGARTPASEALESYRARLEGGDDGDAGGGGDE